jgi:hypothetical protein
MQPSLSGDGNSVAFASHASDLLTRGFMDRNGAQATDVFVRDLVGATTRAASALPTIQNRMQVVLGASKDAAIYRAFPNNANGKGNLRVGQNSGNNGPSGNDRRGLIAFGIAGNVPAGATIVDVTLELTALNLGHNSTTIGLHRLLANWAEGNAVGANGRGATASSSPPDATWNHSFFNTTLWTPAGGQFTATASASRTVSAAGAQTWATTNALVADVQAWLGTPASNFGWLLRGTESARTTWDFRSREHTTVSERPELTVGYLPALGPVEGGNGASQRPALGQDGTVVAFESLADDLVTNFVDHNGSDPDVFFQDGAGVVSLVSVSTVGALDGGNAGSFRPSMTPDGNWIAFDSLATDLVATDGNSVADVFARDRANSTTVRVSSGNGGVEPSGASIRGVLGSNRGRAVFESAAANLIGGFVDTNEQSDVFRSNR